MINIDAFNQVIAPLQPDKIVKKTKVKATQASNKTGGFDQQPSEDFTQTEVTPTTTTSVTEEQNDGNPKSHHRIDISI